MQVSKSANNLVVKTNLSPNNLQNRREDIGDPNADSDVPTSQFFSEGNGGEFRKSFHGYPKVLIFEIIIIH